MLGGTPSRQYSLTAEAVTGSFVDSIDGLRLWSTNEGNFKSWDTLAILTEKVKDSSDQLCW
jgi:hypothetical protein